jgi:hypothetical protein
MERRTHAAWLTGLGLLLAPLGACLDPPPPPAPTAVRPPSAEELERARERHEREEAAEDEAEKVALMKPAERERYLAQRRAQKARPAAPSPAPLSR